MADRATLCAEMGHPGVTHNPTADKTWCICGARTYPGRADTVDRHLACCDGPLSATPKATAEPATRQEALL